MRVRCRAPRQLSPADCRAAFRRPDGDWLERRVLLAATPFFMAEPLHFGLFHDATESHFLSTPAEFDLYSVPLQSGDTLAVTISAQQSGSALASLLRVFDASGTPLLLDNQQGGDPELTFQAATAGTYYIGVSSAPDNNYNPLIADSGTPGGTTGVYTLDVRETSGPLMPDLAGSSFRTGLDMAAAGESIPVSFTVQNRGGADPGNFQVQVLLAPNNLFDSSSRVLATFSRSQLVADGTGRSFSSPAGFSVTLPAGWESGPADLGLRIEADPAVPEAGLYDKSGVHRGSDWAPLTIVTAGPAATTELSAIDPGLNTETIGTLTAASPVTTHTITVSTTLGNGELEAEVSARSGDLLPRLTLSGATGQVLIQSDSEQIVQALQPGTYLLTVSQAAGAGGYRLTTAFTQTSLPFAPLASGAGTASVAVGDLTGDGIPDIVTANRIDDTVSVFLGTGDGTFLPPRTYAIGARVWHVTLADLTNNGRLDILTSNKGANTISVLLNNGDGTFQPQIVIPAGTRVVEPTVADVNGDGIPDLIFSNYAADTIWVLLGNGNGTFQAPQIYTTDQGPGFAGPTGVTVADLTGDGLPDLIYADYVASNVSVRMNLGNGTFGPEVTYTTGAGAYAVSVADLNGDGIPDLVCVNSVADDVSVLMGNGNGTFQPAKNYKVGLNPYSMAMADFNGDGIPDVVTSNRGDNTVSVLLGNGDGTFAPEETFPTGKT
ncbi:MAG: FG-GAP-like repeat-containing protein, partial [Isosphaeraceae bacterium]